MSQQLQQVIEAAWEDRANISVASASAEVRDAVEHVLNELDAGRLRVASREAVGQWTTHQWIKKAVLLSFRLKDNVLIKSGDLSFYDKVPTKFSDMDEAGMRATGSHEARFRDVLLAPESAVETWPAATPPGPVSSPRRSPPRGRRGRS
jgi:2,3,4,5-tetrahydropyridine-2-carboxylate N-succinyltransferase